MGQKDAELSSSITERADQLVTDLVPLGDVTAKAMFGGVGIFESGVMFAMVDSAGVIRLRAAEDTSSVLVDAGGDKLSRTPYWSVSDELVADTDTLVEWARTALDVARAAKKK